MKYIIISLIKGEVEEYHQQLVERICERFKSCHLASLDAPTHFTLKGIFEAEEVIELEQRLESFCENHKAQKIKVSGFDNFQDNVVFMGVKMSSDAYNMYEEFICELEKISWMQWQDIDKDKRRFHFTVASSDISENYEEICKYLQKYDKTFEAFFDNIAIYREAKEEGKWELYRSFEMRH